LLLLLLLQLKVVTWTSSRNGERLKSFMVQQQQHLSIYLLKPVATSNVSEQMTVDYLWKQKLVLIF